MLLYKAQDLFSLHDRDSVSKGNLFDLIQFSKVKDLNFWSGPDNLIGNTPQQGINWIGRSPELQGVIIKVKSGSYQHDGWLNANTYRYSFKANKGKISYRDKANEVLIRQPQYGYPILLFTDHKAGWIFEGRFTVSALESEFVLLDRSTHHASSLLLPQDEIQFQEGGKKYITHLMAERSDRIVNVLKRTNAWVCDICCEDFSIRYGVKYIEAHHKVPISTFSNKQAVKFTDFALLCPNCHKAVHIYMKKHGYDYLQIKDILQKDVFKE